MIVEKTCINTAETIMQFIFEEWTYAPNTTSASTHMSEVLHQRRGVCQDFAHVTDPVCGPALENPARYVSGYIYNGPDAHLRGAQASPCLVRSLAARSRLVRPATHQQHPFRRTLREDRHRARL